MKTKEEINAKADALHEEYKQALKVGMYIQAEELNRQIMLLEWVVD